LLFQPWGNISPVLEFKQNPKIIKLGQNISGYKKLSAKGLFKINESV
jgi:hypothetical protein